MNNKIVYIELAKAIELHNWIIDKAGYVCEMKEQDGLDSILQQIKNDGDYPEFKHKLTQLVCAINESQEIIEDSKRLSIVLGCFFLELNGYDYVVFDFVREMENIIVWLAQKRINKELLSEIIESLIYEEYYSEELKLKIATAIGF
ncbi:Death on curing protein [Hyella patelloides LEGE 07179]|uniref:Death on curing protein n=1 Tax=Hyella patelloides LEGE 07179 TaxID=945734 RepID=A0A563W4I1_9CYAN|nr:type II toxin-antitoxin system death-on-curing family toxin [Hyella patelloides]VEP18601.1 Death on curing protein [Hyella patelloides LEGE 07179]